MNCRSILQKTVLPVLAPAIGKIIGDCQPEITDGVTEIRLRANKPLILLKGNQVILLNAAGRLVINYAAAYKCTQDDLGKTIQLICRNSLYAFEQEMAMGFVTVPGGHRVGLAGQAIINKGEIRSLKNISSINFRIAREVYGAADKIIPYVVAGDHRIYNTLIISPPRCGKTTILRDLTRMLSAGVPSLKFSGVQVGLVDERSEIAACQDGVATADLGPCVDVLDGCPKSTGMLMLIRSMAPQVIITDELGREEDVQAIREAIHAGVSVVASVHGKDAQDILGRPYIGELIRHRLFDRYVTLIDLPQIGTVEEVVAAESGELLYSRKNGVRANVV
jgi:stage III sporulation protein AA